MTVVDCVEKKKANLTDDSFLIKEYITLNDIKNKRIWIWC